MDIGYVIPKSEVIGLELDSHSQISGENERCKMYPSPSFLGLVRALNGYPPPCFVTTTLVTTRNTIDNVCSQSHLICAKLVAPDGLGALHEVAKETFVFKTASPIYHSTRTIGDF